MRHLAAASQRDTSPQPPPFPFLQASHSRNPYSHAIVFLVGAGNYLEYQSLRQAVAHGGGQLSTAIGGRRVTYGCTEVLSPKEFVHELSQLGDSA